MIAGADTAHFGAGVDDNAGPFVTENGREQPFRVVARKRKRVGVAYAGGLDFDQNFALARAADLDSFNTEGLARLKGDRGT